MCDYEELSNKELVELINDLEQNVDDYETRVEDLEDDIREYKDEISELEDEIDELKVELDSFENPKETRTIYEQLCDMVAMSRLTPESDLIGRFAWLICNKRSKVDRVI